MDWERRYVDENTPWDLGGVAPPLRHVVESGAWPLEGAARILVPGAGRGHDLVYLAERGFEVVGIDLSQTAVAYAAMEARDRGVAGRVEVLVGDVLDPRPSWDAAFDAVYELTCYCALEPELRGAYVDKVAATVRPGGWILALLFPLRGSPFDRARVDSIDGPPHLVEVDEFAARFEARGFERRADFAPGVPTPSRVGSERWLWLQLVR